MGLGDVNLDKVNFDLFIMAVKANRTSPWPPS